MALAARQLPRCAGGEVGGQPDGVEGGGDAAATFGSADALGVHAQRLGDALADAHPGIQGGDGILQRHTDTALQPAPLATTGAGEHVAEDADVTRVGFDQAEHDPRHGGFPGARFADQAEGFAGRDLQRDVVERGHGVPAAAETHCYAAQVNIGLGRVGFGARIGYPAPRRAR